MLVIVGCGGSNPPIQDFDYNTYKTFYIKNAQYDQCVLTTKSVYVDWPMSYGRYTDVYTCGLPRECRVYVDHYTPTSTDSDCAY